MLKNRPKVTRISKKLGVFLLGIFLLLPYLNSLQSVFAQSFTPVFEFALPDPTPGINSDIEMVINQETSGESAFKKITVTVPAGFEFTSSTELGQFEKIGQGTFDAGSGVYNTLVSLYSDQTLGPGQKAHWVLVFDDARLPQIDVFLTGNSTTGHTFVIEFPPSVLPLPTPIFWPLTIFGSSHVSPNTIVKNPTTGGTYTWKADFVSFANETVSYQFGIGFSGATTEIGSDIVASFGSTVSATFSQVTGSGETTIVSTTSPPTEGTGRFQLGGLYYDFITTAKVECPCTITLPYDPKITEKPSIYHLEDGIWVDVTTSFDDKNFTVTGVVSSFSFFAVGTPTFGVDWRLPLEWPNGQKSVFSSRILILPIIFSLVDSNGGYVQRDDVTVQVLNGNGQVVAELPPRYILRDGKFYIAMLRVRQLNLPAGEYIVKAKVGNTLVSPPIDFILR